MTPEALSLTGIHIRLEPLHLDHVKALAAAAAADPSLYDENIYRWTFVPQDIAEAALYIETALGWRDEGTAVPFVVVRQSDNTVIGSTRFFNIERWPWPVGHERHDNPYPDVCEIGYTWYTRSAIRTAANTEGKFLMLQHAFEVWKVLRVSLNTDSRNLRSQAAMERIGFKREGLLRAQRISSDFIPRDSVRYSMLPDEWPEAKQRLTERIQSS
ncbi:MAG: GNAT family protein [Silvibacterium sp.]